MKQSATPTLARIRAYLKSDMRTLRWVFLGLYALVIIGLSTPMFLTNDDDGLVIWAILIGTVLVSQALFIFGSGTINLCYPIEKRRFWMPILAASFMLTILAAGLFLAIAELVYLDRYLRGETMTFAFIGVIAFSWFGWGVLLWARFKNTPRYTALARLTTLIFAGSLAELLGSIPSHLVVSKRPGCLVGLGTMVGIVAGIQVMFFAFGPGIVLLFLRPRYRKENMENPLCPKCQYNLTGTLAANRTACPECGAPVPASLTA